MFLFFFNQPWDLRAPSANRRKTLPHDQHQRRFYNASPKILGASPKKFGAKIMKNFRQFYTTSEFDREYLRKETRYPKSERHVISSYSSRVQLNKSGELWSIIHKVVHVSLDPPKSTFSTDYILAPKGLAPEIFTRARHWTKLASAHRKSGQGSPKILRANI